MGVSAFAPGRVNLIGDHTDHTGGLVLPLAIQLGTTVVGERGGAVVELTSDHDPRPVVVPLGDAPDLERLPPWGRYVAGVVGELQPSDGFTGRVTTTLPVGAGLSSSAALTVSLALALGAGPDQLALAELCQRAEQRAVGVPCGIMDQLTAVAGVEGSALLIDTGAKQWRPVPIPDQVHVVVVDSGEPRALVDSAYAEIRARCVDGEAVARRHVGSENDRAHQVAELLPESRFDEIGELMVASHRSLADLGVSTPALDSLVERLIATPGVYGARLTGAGFGGSVVVLCRLGALDEGWVAHPSAGAALRSW